MNDAATAVVQQSAHRLAASRLHLFDPIQFHQNRVDFRNDGANRMLHSVYAAGQDLEHDTGGRGGGKDDEGGF